MSSSESSGRVPRREAMTAKGKPRCKAVVCGEKIDMGAGKVARYQMEQCDKQCAAGAEFCTVCERAMPKYLAGEAGRIHGMANLRQIADWSHGYTNKSKWHREQTAKEMGKLVAAVTKATAAAAKASVVAAEVQTAAAISDKLPASVGPDDSEVRAAMAAKQEALMAAKKAAEEAHEQYELAKKLRLERDAAYKTLLKETSAVARKTRKVTSAEKAEKAAKKAEELEKRKTQKAIKDMERATAKELAAAKKAATAAEREAKKAEKAAAKGVKPAPTMTAALHRAFSESGAIDRGYSSSSKRRTSSVKSKSRKARTVRAARPRRSLPVSTPKWSNVSSGPSVSAASNWSSVEQPRFRQEIPAMKTPRFNTTSSPFNADAALANLMSELGEAGSVAF